MKHTRIVALLAFSTLASACAMAPARNDSSPVAAAVITAGSSTAQLPAPGDPYLDPQFLERELTVDRAVQAALVNNPQVRAQLARLDAAQAERVQAGLIANPMLSLMALRPEGGGRFELDYSLMQNLFDLITRSRRIAVADAASRQAEADVIGQLVALVQDTKAAYFDALSAQAGAAAQAELWVIEKQRLQLLSGQARQGAISAVAMVEQQGVRSRQTHQLQSAQARLSRARSDLARQMGLASASGLRLPANLPAFGMPGLDEPALQALAAFHRAELRAAGASVEQARAERVLQTGGLRATQPSLGLAGVREMSGQSLLGPSLQLSLPIFDTGQARRDLAAAREAQAGFASEAIRRQVPLEVELAIATLVTANAAAEAADQHVNQLQQLEKLALKTYQQGVGDSANLLSARRARLESVMEKIDAQQVRWTAIVNLERAVGVAVLGPAPAQR